MQYWIGYFLVNCLVYLSVDTYEQRVMKEEKIEKMGWRGFVICLLIGLPIMVWAFLEMIFGGSKNV